jgi:hypothetical protein
MTTVLATDAGVVGMAAAFFRTALLDTRVIDGRGYVIINGDIPNRTFDCGGEVVVEVRCFETRRMADRWIDRDVAARRRPS